MKKILLATFAALSLIISPTFAVQQSNVVILDVRTAEEFAEGHLPGAIQIDFHDKDFKSKIGKLDKAKTYKLHCLSGSRSQLATDEMKSLGFTNVENLGSLKQASAKLNLPITTGK